MSVILDAAKFHNRAKYLLDFWKDSPDDFGSANVLVVAVGQSQDDVLYQKSIAVQTWLLGYEFPETVLAITPDRFYFVTSSKKGKILESLQQDSNKGATIEIMGRTKDEAHNKELMAKLADIVAESKKVGTLPKDRFEGKVIKEWESAMKGKDVELVDMAPGIALALAVKDDSELDNVAAASRISSAVMSRYFLNEMSSIIDEDKKVKQDVLAQKMERCLTDDPYRQKLKLKDVCLIDVAPVIAYQLMKIEQIDYALADWCYTPIIQSGGKYDLRPSATTNSDHLHEGTIICSVGVRYKSYCSNLSRTYLMNPEKSQEENYRFLLRLQDFVFNSTVDGVVCSDVYNKAAAYVAEKRPDLKENFLKNCGFGIGIEFRESAFLLSGKNNRVLKSGMVLHVAVGFQNLEHPKPADAKSKIYALLLGDTLRVTKGAPQIFTEAKKDEQEVFFEFKDDESSEEEVAVKKEKARASGAPSPARGGRGDARSSRRKEEVQNRMQHERTRAEHQKQLHKKLQELGQARGAGTGKEKEQSVFRKFESYRNESLLPKNTHNLQIVVDKRSDSIVLPIYGMAVPFHVSTIKNVSKQDEQEFTYLRFNFITPGQSAGKKDVQTPFEDPTATFIRALSFRSTDNHRFTEIFREINDLKKDLQKREAERKEMADLVEQDKLTELRGRRPPRLPEVFCRPQMEGKRLPGDLEIHSNGLRYQSQMRSDQKVDILFSNIKHMFFQPCDQELVVILHLHLKNPIMAGKKKTKDIQFYREVTDASFDETGTRNRRRPMYGDEDELMQEQEERKRRQQLNKEFHNFATLIKDASKGVVEVDVPVRQVGFMGVPVRQLVLMQPTTNCLVHLTDFPPLVITLDELELVHFERVQFGLKNFDLVFVFKDFTRAPVHINTIPAKSLDDVKDWLDQMDLPFTEGTINLNWSSIMKTVNDDTAMFFDDGGWSFLNAHDENEEDSEEEVSEYEEESGSDFGGSESDTDEAYESDDASASGSGFSGSDDDSDGEDWDEMERKAAKSDAKRGADTGKTSSKTKRRDDSDDDSDDSDRPAKKSKKR
ncbi:FACT complex subunit spt16 [Rhizophlyctis rosea]|uniref:FACT complex subunit n=1 Tax=Rhizophlyctis rosea TaxID=64517 RepID=A0AAD5SKF5_9FUNG|nr:FACT complex subunit spt16 [Rhizophlyctis rosea]